MTTADEVPVWAEPIRLEQWRTQLVESQALQYRMPIARRWNQTPQVETVALQQIHLYQSNEVGEWLAIRLTKQADLAHDLGSWVNSAMQLTGFPTLPPLPAGVPSPQLLEWHDHGACPPLAQHLQVDETHLYHGLAQLAGQPPELIRLYTLLARRHSLAWNINLAFLSACLPGMPEEMIVANDHVRAGATFGFLQLL